MDVILIAVFLITVVQGIKFSMYNAREEKAFEAKEYTIVGINLAILIVCTINEQVRDFA